MHVYEVIPGIYNLFPQNFFLQNLCTGYYRKQQNETGYFYGMTLQGNTESRWLEFFGIETLFECFSKILFEQWRCFSQ